MIYSVVREMKLWICTCLYDPVGGGQVVYMWGNVCHVSLVIYPVGVGSSLSSLCTEQLNTWFDNTTVQTYYNLTAFILASEVNKRFGQVFEKKVVFHIETKNLYLKYFVFLSLYELFNVSNGNRGNYGMIACMFNSDEKMINYNSQS